MREDFNLWKEVGDRCLKSAIAMLDDETTPKAMTVAAISALVDTAIAIDTLNLQWAKEKRKTPPTWME